jgi:hypothetical protein
MGQITKCIETIVLIVIAVIIVIINKKMFFEKQKIIGKMNIIRALDKQ